MVPDNDSDLVEVKGIEVPEGLDLFDVADPAPPPQAEAPSSGVPAEPEALPPPAVPSAPAWLTDIPEAERAAVIASGLSTLSPEALLSLEPVRELLGQAQNLTAAQMAEQNRHQNEQAVRQQNLYTEANAFKQDLASWVPPESGIDIDQRTDNFTLAVQQDYHQFLTGQLQNGILAGFARLGLGPQNLPPSLVAQVGAARGYDGVVKAYVDAAADRGFELGRLKERNDSGTRTKADETALRARIRNEVLGQLSKENKVSLGQDESGYFAQLQAGSTPPSLSGTPVPASSELDDAEVLAALADPDAYDRLMSDPAKARAFNKAMAGEMARQ